MRHGSAGGFEFNDPLTDEWIEKLTTEKFCYKNT